MCWERSATTKEGDTEPARAHVRPCRGNQVLRRVPKGPAQLT